MTDIDNQAPEVAGSNKRGKLKIFVTAHIIVQGLIIALLLIAFAILVGSGDPVDLSPQGKVRLSNIAFWISGFGIAFFLLSILSIIPWLRDKMWSKYLLLILILISIPLMVFPLLGIGFLSPLVFVLILALLSINLVTLVAIFRSNHEESSER